MRRVPILIVSGLGEPSRTEMTAQILGLDSFEVVELRYDQHNHKTVKVTHNYMRSPSEDDGPVPAYREVGRGAQA